MSDKKATVSNSTSGGIGFWGLLQIVFITLKLTGYITWPWLWVLAPTWIGICLTIGIVLMFILGVVILAALKKV